jgi:hypothetical protein
MEQGSHALHGSCAQSALPACAFSLDVPERATARLSLETSGFDGTLALFAGPRESAHELACVDDTPTGDAQHAHLETTLAPGRYWVVVDSADGSEGEFELFSELDDLTSVSAACAAPRKLVEGVTVRDSTRGGADQFSSTCAGGAQGPDHVYALSVPVPSRLRVRQDSDYDGALTLRKTCADATSEVACNDDFTLALKSALTTRVDAGTYYLITDSFSAGQSGEYALTVERMAEPSPRTLTELCDESDALPVKPGYHEVDTLGALSRSEGSCGGADAPEARLRFVLDKPSVLRVSLEQREFDAVLYLLRDCRDEASEVTCFDHATAIAKSGNPNENPALERELSPGAYTLVIDGKTRDDMGATGVRLSLEPRGKKARISPRDSSAHGAPRP